jgi:hypothetical protein
VQNDLAHRCFACAYRVRWGAWPEGLRDAA